MRIQKKNNDHDFCFTLVEVEQWRLVILQGLLLSFDFSDISVVACTMPLPKNLLDFSYVKKKIVDTFSKLQKKGKQT